MAMNAVSADVVLILHVAYVAAVVLGLAAIWIGWWCGARWVRNPWIRGGHLVMIAVVVAESWIGVICPLTTWEWQLRLAAGQSPSNPGPIAPWLHPLLFVDAEWWVFTTCYSSFGLLVLLSFIVIRPTFSPSRGTRSG
jgi:hypothetical protein